MTEVELKCSPDPMAPIKYMRNIGLVFQPLKSQHYVCVTTAFLLESALTENAMERQMLDYHSLPWSWGMWDHIFDVQKHSVGQKAGEKFADQACGREFEV